MHCQRFLDHFDFFKAPLTLHFKKSRFISTKSGLVFSLSILSILITMTINSDFFDKTSPSVLTSISSPIKRPLIQLKRRILAFGVQDDETQLGITENEQVFTMKVRSVRTTSDSLDVVDHGFHLCESSDFIDPTVFRDLGFGTFYCLDDQDQSFDLRGYFDEQEADFLMIQLFLCMNSTSNGSCKSFEDIEEILNGNTFNVFFKDTVLDPKDYENPIKEIIVNKYLYIDVKYRKNLDLFFQPLDLETDDNALLVNKKLIREIQFSSEKTDFFSTQTDSLKSRVTLNFFSEKREFFVKRTYMKFSELMGRLGGTLNLMVFLAYAFINIEQNLLVKRTILNSLYLFPRVEGNDKLKMNFDKGNHRIQKSVLPARIADFLTSQKQFLTRFVKKTMRTKDKFSEQVSIDKSCILKMNQIKEELDSKKLRISLFQYLRLRLNSVLRIFRVSYEEEVFEKSEDIYQKELDFIHLLRKLQEIEKLKLVLLSPEQRSLFECLAKPLIYFGNEGERMGSSRQGVDLNEKREDKTSRLQKAVESFENKNREQGLNDVDKRILGLVNKDLKGFSPLMFSSLGRFQDKKI